MHSRCFSDLSHNLRTMHLKGVPAFLERRLDSEPVRSSKIVGRGGSSQGTCQYQMKSWVNEWCWQEHGHVEDTNASDPWERQSHSLVHVWMLTVCTENVHWSFFLPDIYTSRLLLYRDPLPRTAKLELHSLFGSIQEIHLFNSGMTLIQPHQNMWLDWLFCMCLSFSSFPITWVRPIPRPCMVIA